MINFKVNGAWGDWTSVNRCSITCLNDGVGNQDVNRECNNPPKKYGGADCPGPSKKTWDCNNGQPQCRKYAQHTNIA